MELEGALPRPLVPREGPIPFELCAGSVASLGERARAVRELVEEGFVPPDVLTGMSLYLLSGQPKRARSGSGSKSGAIAGGVWVRERVTVHRPVRIDQPVTVSGESAGRFAKRGRRYGITTSETRASDGRLLVSNVTIGLLRYRKDPALADGEEGRPASELGIVPAEPGAAAGSPALDALRKLRLGERISGPPSLVTLELMRARDGDDPRNPIHTDPEVARREGLAAPIAGGSHVLAFLNETLMREWGPRALCHGAELDVRWIGQTPAGGSVVPSATVREARSDRVELDVSVECDGAPALVGRLRLPLE